ncbi:uncharacterized protein SCHCODRAFT_02634447 [Schizophyllum commune H4-8]|nr:uncharacterized protein SCHCODRAFT_02634447 [Schizophyllum commune H4-8]KAI5889411.1 hypothetical protein SCHCODRAFT_02634447 [Schizophyllum commune H4-8]
MADLSSRYLPDVSDSYLLDESSMQLEDDSPDASFAFQMPIAPGRRAVPADITQDMSFDLPASGHDNLLDDDGDDFLGAADQTLGTPAPPRAARARGTPRLDSTEKDTQTPRKSDGPLTLSQLTPRAPKWLPDDANQDEDDEESYEEEESAPLPAMNTKYDDNQPIPSGSASNAGYSFDDSSFNEVSTFAPDAESTFLSDADMSLDPAATRLLAYSEQFGLHNTFAPPAPPQYNEKEATPKRSPPRNDEPLTISQLSPRKATPSPTKKTPRKAKTPAKTPFTTRKAKTPAPPSAAAPTPHPTEATPVAQAVPSPVASPSSAAAALPAPMEAISAPPPSPPKPMRAPSPMKRSSKRQSTAREEEEEDEEDDDEPTTAPAAAPSQTAGPLQTAGPSQAAGSSQAAGPSQPPPKKAPAATESKRPAKRAKIEPVVKRGLNASKNAQKSSLTERRRVPSGPAARGPATRAVSGTTTRVVSGTTTRVVSGTTTARSVSGAASRPASAAAPRVTRAVSAAGTLQNSRARNQAPVGGSKPASAKPPSQVATTGKRENTPAAQTQAKSVAQTPAKPVAQAQVKPVSRKPPSAAQTRAKPVQPAQEPAMVMVADAAPAQEDSQPAAPAPSMTVDAGEQEVEEPEAGAASDGDTQMVVEEASWAVADMDNCDDSTPPAPAPRALSPIDDDAEDELPLGQAEQEQSHEAVGEASAAPAATKPRPQRKQPERKKQPEVKKQPVPKKPEVKKQPEAKQQPEVKKRPVVRKHPEVLKQSEPKPPFDASSSSDTSKPFIFGAGKQAKFTLSTSSDAGSSRLHESEGSAHARSLSRSALNMSVTEPKPFTFHTDMRLREREAFDAKVKERLKREEEEEAERRRQAEEEAEREVKQLRKRMVPRAHEVPEWYRSAPKKQKLDESK